MGTSTSYFCRPHAPPTLLILTRISQIGCDSPALAVSQFPSHNECKALPTAFIFSSHSQLQRAPLSDVCSHTGAHTVSLEFARCQKMFSHTHAGKHTSLNTTWQLCWFISHRSVLDEGYQPIGISFCIFLKLWQNATLQCAQGQKARWREKRATAQEMLTEQLLSSEDQAFLH